uniref:Ion transport domain-containing protein n=1 Tax=Cryptomonas curvata TaxID=233186 RepID=A0A7S0QJ39_9CRYP|mmetsp:Transcript_28013/g.58347  ORF Transcript_28013/g.58347 Transcript_28013/m.58347 type:complete len:547 (+) Transcript_28013:2165-3805(+)
MNYLLQMYNPEMLLRRSPGAPHFSADANDSDETQQVETIGRVNKMEQVKAQAEDIALLYYIVYSSLAAYDKSGQFNAKLNSDWLWDFESLRGKIGVIEISRGGALEKACFVVPRVCRYLTRAMKESVIAGVNRANLQTQLAGLVEHLEPLYEEMRHQQRLTDSLVLNVFRTTLIWRERIFFCLGIAINVCMLLFYSYECNGTFICGDNEKLIRFRLKPGWRELVKVLTAIQSFFALTRLWWYIVEIGIPRVNRLLSSHAHTLRINPLLAWLVRLPPNLATASSSSSFGSIPSVVGWLQVQTVCLLYALSDMQLWIIAVMATTNVLALLITSEWASLLLTAHVFEVFAHFRVLQNVMRSITYRGGTLLQTAGLALVMIYLFGVAGFALFPDVFQFAEAELSGGRKLEPNNNGASCTSIWKCTLVILDMGVRKEDVGESMNDLPWTLDNREGYANPNLIYYRIIYTLLFFCLITTILMNIIFGVIIDTFAELRSKKEQIDLDMSGRCFICGLDRFIFDEAGRETGDGFQHHITHEHNIWKYIFFLVLA